MFNHCGHLSVKNLAFKKVKSREHQRPCVSTKPASFVFVSVCCCVCFVLQITFGKQQDNKFQRHNPLSLFRCSLLANTLSVGACVWCLHNTRVIARKGIRTAKLLSPQIIVRRPATAPSLHAPTESDEIYK